MVTNLRPTQAEWLDSLCPFSSMSSKLTWTRLPGWCLNTGETIWMSLSWCLWVSGYDSVRAWNQFCTKTKPPHLPARAHGNHCYTITTVLQCCFLLYWVSMCTVCNATSAHPHHGIHSSTGDKPPAVSTKPQMHQLLGAEQLSPNSVRISSKGLHSPVPPVTYISNPALFYTSSVWADKTPNSQHSCFRQHIWQRTKLSRILHRKLLQSTEPFQASRFPPFLPSTKSMNTREEMSCWITQAFGLVSLCFHLLTVLGFGAHWQ